jgi:hypothetical protein
MAEWVQRHVSALVDSASERDRVATDHRPDHERPRSSQSHGATTIADPGDQATPAPGRSAESESFEIEADEEQDPVELTLHGREARNS